MFFPLSKTSAVTCQQIVRNTFTEIINDLQNDNIHAYTDGSHSQESHITAYVVFIPSLNSQFSWKLNDHSSIFTAKLYGIKNVLVNLYETSNSEITIFSDSWLQFKLSMVTLLTLFL